MSPEGQADARDTEDPWGGNLDLGEFGSDDVPETGIERYKAEICSVLGRITVAKLGLKTLPAG